MQGSQDKLKQVLEDKLFDYEAGVPRNSRDNVLNRLRLSRTRGTIRRTVYTTTLIMMIASVTYYLQMSNGIAPTALATSVPIPRANSSQPPTESTPVKTETSRTIGQSADLIVQAESEATRATAVNDDSVASGVVVVNSEISEPTESQKPDNSTPELNELAEEVKTVDVQEIPTESIEVSTESKQYGRWRISIGAMPTLNYKRIVPNGSDNSYIYAFETPSSFHSSRLGVTTTLLIHREMKKGRTIYGGAGYFNYKTRFLYSSSESGSGLTAANEVDETISGVTFALGGTWPLKSSDKHQFNLDTGAQLQSPKNGPQVVFRAGLEYGLRLGKQQMLIIEPVFFHSLTPLHYTGLIAYPYGAGVDIRYQMSLGSD